MELTIINKQDRNHQGPDAIDPTEVPLSYDSSTRSRCNEEVLQANRQDLGD
jgi:hypothetical protein